MHFLNRFQATSYPKKYRNWRTGRPTIPIFLFSRNLGWYIVFHLLDFCRKFSRENKMKNDQARKKTAKRPRLSVKT